MDRVCAISMVDETHHRLSSLAHHESRAWCHAIIANQLGLAQVRVDLQSGQYCRHHVGLHLIVSYLLLELLDIDLVVINCWAVVIFELSRTRSAQEILNNGFDTTLTSSAP
jgi:hypothetical protein